jgi:hypothetical protein
MKPALADFYTAHLEWLGLRASLVREEKRAFALWATRTHPELIAPYRAEPASFRLMCQEVQRGGRMPFPKGIGEATLRRYAGDLMRHYRSLPEEGREKFQDFVNRILEECPTERALRRFLGLKSEGHIT